MSDQNLVQKNIHSLQDQIAQLRDKYACTAPVRLIAVSKTKPADLIEQAIHAGMTDIAENYLQEALEKKRLLRHLEATWHFIGPIQSNKTLKIAENFDWVHSVASIKVAQRLGRQRPPELDLLNVLIQVNISAEESKSGVPPAAVVELAVAIAQLPGLRLRGLMAVPAPGNSLIEQRLPFRALAELLSQVQSATQMPDIDQLSMGMSQDMEAAIAEGSTMVRIGTAIFGSRVTPAPQVNSTP